MRVAFSGTINSTVPWLSRLFLQYTGTAPTAAQLTTFNTALNTAWTGNLKGLCGSEIVLTEIESTDLTSALAAQAVTGVSNAGNRSGGLVPSSACVVTSYEIARRYRGGHPRGYWPFGTDTDVSTELVWAAGLLTSVNTDLPAFIAAAAAAVWSGGGTISQVNVSYYHGFTVVTDPVTGRARNKPTLRTSVTPDAVTSIVARASIGTQRRRIAFVN